MGDGVHFSHQGPATMLPITGAISFSANHVFPAEQETTKSETLAPQREIYLKPAPMPMSKPAPQPLSEPTPPQPVPQPTPQPIARALQQPAYISNPYRIRPVSMGEEKEG